MLPESLRVPPHIYSTPERPDIVLWSSKLKRVILIELTCPAEENIKAANIRKEGKYTTLKNSINDDTETKFSCTLWTIEVGVRGFVGRSVLRCLRKLGLPPRARKKLCKKLSLTVAKCSYAIYLARKTRDWDGNRTLIAPEVPQQEVETKADRDRRLMPPPPPRSPRRPARQSPAPPAASAGATALTRDQTPPPVSAGVTALFRFLDRARQAC